MVLTINRYYATLRTLDKKGLIVGASEKNGNMPFRTVYSISEKGKEELEPVHIKIASKIIAKVRFPKYRASSLS